MQNCNTIVTQIQLRCKLNIFHIKTSKIEKTHHLYIYIYIYNMTFLHFEAHEFCFTIITHILLKFDDIESM
jgi:hypothetical protein